MLFVDLKTGEKYRLISLATNEDDLSPVAIYSNVETGFVWVRPAEEFFDGRFRVCVPSEPPHAEVKKGTLQ